MSLKKIQVKGSFLFPYLQNESDDVRIEMLDNGNLKICPIPQSGQGSKGIGVPTNDRLKEVCRL